MTHTSRRATWATVLLTAFMAAVAATTASAERPVLRVEFKLLEPLYRLSFGDDEIAKLERDASADIAHTLHCEYPFLDFTAENAPDKVTIELGREDPDTNVRPVYYHVKISGASITEIIKPSSVLFRPQADASRSTGSRKDFREEIDNNFRENLDSKVLSRDVFSNVTLTKKAFPLPDNDTWYWILPFSPSDLGITIEDSVFVVKANLSFPGALRLLEHHAHAYGLCLERPEVPAAYHHKLMTRFGDEDANKLQELLSSDSQEIIQVRVEDFERTLQAALQPAGPTSLLSSDAADQEKKCRY